MVGMEADPRYPTPLCSGRKHRHSRLSDEWWSQVEPQDAQFLSLLLKWLISLIWEWFFFVNLYIFSEILAKEEKYNLNFFSNVTHFFSLLNINNEVKIMLFLFTSILQFFLLISLPLLGGGEVPQTFLVGPLKSWSPKNLTCKMSVLLPGLCVSLISLAKYYSLGRDSKVMSGINRAKH